MFLDRASRDMRAVDEPDEVWTEISMAVEYV